MVEDQGNIIIEGSDWLQGIAINRKPREVYDFEPQKDGDKAYMVFLEALVSYANGGKANTQTKSSSNSKEQIDEDWFHTESTESANDDSDIEHGATENESGIGVDCDETEMVIYEEGDDYDPDYNMFLNNIDDRGHTYVLEISRKGCNLIAKYEDTELIKRVPESNPASRNTCHNPRTKEKNAALSKNTKLNAAIRSPARYPVKSKSSAQRNDRNSSTYTRKRKVGGKEKNKVRKKARKTIVEDETSEDLEEPMSQRPSHKTSSRKNARKTVVEDETSDDLEEPVSQRLSHRTSSRKKARKTVVEDETSDDVEEPMSQRPSPVVWKNLSRRPGKHSKGKNYKDKNYSTFLCGVSEVDGDTVFTEKDGRQWRYDQYPDEHTSDPNAQALILLPPSSNKMNPKPNNKQLQSPASDKMNTKSSNKQLQSPASDKKNKKPSNMQLQASAGNKVTPKLSKTRILSSDKKDSSYTEKLMEILLKPYDRKEHGDLLKEAKLRRPVLHHRDMRSQNCSFPDEVEVDKSYLDRYEALDREIKAAERDDPHKVLLHLRGLFFWLQHVCMDKSFQPWTDKSWLEAVNRRTSNQKLLTDSK